MTQEKLRKIITASVAAATLLLVFLFSYLIYQWITIAVLDKRIEKIEEENARLEEVLNSKESDLAYYESVFGKEWLAFNKGFVYPSEDK